MAEDTWTTRAMPVLEAIAAAEEAGADVAEAAHAAYPTDAPPHAYVQLIHSLQADGYIRAQIDDGGFSDIMFVYPNGLLPRGRRAIGQWPSEDVGGELLKVLNLAVERATDDETRSRLERFRDAALGLGRDVLTGVATSYAQRLVG